jgi:translation initiation factor 3 subunit C
MIDGYFHILDKAHQTLADIQLGSQVKELLGEGVHMMYNQEIKNRQGLLPFHKHTNLELIECIYLVSAMLIEVSSMASRLMF